MADFRFVAPPGGMWRNDRANWSVSMCWKIDVASTVKCGSDLFARKAANAESADEAFRRVMSDPERSVNESARRTRNLLPSCKWASRHVVHPLRLSRVIE